MYQILIIDENQEVPIEQQKSRHTFRMPQIGEHIPLRWKGETKICEVEDVWTRINMDKEKSYQGAVQILARWRRGHDPAKYLQRFQMT